MVVIVVVVVVVVVIVVVVVVVAAVVVMVLLAATATGIYSPVAIWRQKRGVWAARLQKGFPQLGRRTLFSGSHWLGYDCSNLVSFHYMSKSTSTFAYIKLSHTITTKPHNDNLQFPSHKPQPPSHFRGCPGILGSAKHHVWWLKGGWSRLHGVWDLGVTNPNGAKSLRIFCWEEDSEKWTNWT